MQVTKITRTIGADDAKTRFSKLLQHVEAGNEITITRHGIAVARLVPVQHKTTDARRRAAILAWQKSAKGLTLSPLKMRDLINEGRP